MYSIGSIPGGGSVGLVQFVHSLNVNLIHYGYHGSTATMAQVGSPRSIGPPPFTVLIHLIALYALYAQHSRSEGLVLQTQAVHLPSAC